MADAAVTGPVESETGQALPERKTRRRPQNGGPAGGGAVYGLGMIGALVYFFRSAESGRDQLLAIPRAIVWPALVVYKIIPLLKI